MQRYNIFCNNQPFLRKNRVKTCSRSSFRTRKTTFTTSRSVRRNALPPFNLVYFHSTFSIVIRRYGG